MRPVFVALTAAGFKLALRAREAVGGEVHVLEAAALSRARKDHGGSGESAAGAGRESVGSETTTFSDTATHLRSLFEEGRPLVGFCAAGILVRILAPHLADKRDEPPVVAVSEDGASIVPLLGGHRGANDLARRLAGTLGGHAAITTAGDSRFGVALDAPPPGWTLINPQDAKPAMAALLAGATAQIEGDAPWLAESRIPFARDGTVRLVATTRLSPESASVREEVRQAPRKSGSRAAAPPLFYHPRRLAVGVGCERGADPAEVMALVGRTLAEARLASASVALVASLDLKADEPAVLETARMLGVPARFFTATRLEAETPRLENPSEAVFREVGCHGVAEAAALAAAGAEGRLVAAKQKSARATCAVAEAPQLIEPRSVGHARGRLAVVGIGPGSADWLTPEARRLLQTSDAAVGYSLYLDLVAPLITGAERFDSRLGSEEERVRRALALADEGRDVALVSSGDAGIYAMASLVFECLEDSRVGALPAPGAQRIEIVVAPGISAMQAAAARAGAPLGHDFCAISLSDLLTPWEVIARRIRAAAEGDFVVAFYNPVSERRRAQLAEAQRILLGHRPPDTPVVLARNLGREAESVTTLTLAELSVDAVDMLTLVLVGASSTRTVEAAGQRFVYTPRGYETKRLSPPVRARR